MMEQIENQGGTNRVVEQISGTDKNYLFHFKLLFFI